MPFILVMISLVMFSQQEAVSSLCVWCVHAIPGNLAGVEGR